LIQVAIRFDDPSPSSKQFLERAIIEVFASHGCCVTVAVIPFKRMNGKLVGLTKEGASHLVTAASRGTAEIALHGLAHEQRESTPPGNVSEFAGLASGDQLPLISKGLLRLKEVFGDTIFGFVPPWNSFDAGTLEAVEKLGFRYLSAGWETPLGHRGGVAIVPRTCNVSIVEAAVKEARRARLLSPVIVAVMHHYDFSESGDGEASIDVPALDRLLSWLKKQPDVTISPLGEVAARLTDREYRRALKRHRLREALHWRLRRYVPQYSLLPGPWWHLLVPADRVVLSSGSKQR